MARYEIKGKDGKPKAAAEMSYVASFMEIPTLTCDVSSPNEILFDAGDYVEYDIYGPPQKFKLDRTPNSKQTAKRGSSGDAFNYSLVFYPDEKVLTYYFVTDIVPSDNNVHYTGLTVFSAFCTPQTLVERIQAALNKIDDGWAIGIPPLDMGLANIEGVSLSFNQTSIWDALKMANKTWGLRFIINGHNIILCSETFSTQKISKFSCGKGNGLLDIAEDITDDPIVTRLIAYGGSRNLPLDYSQRIDTSGIRYTPNLMLPEYFDSGGNIDYVENKEAVSKYGIRYYCHIFEGIFPTIENVTVGEYNNTNNTQRIDEVISVTPNEFKEGDATFDILVNFPFDLNEYSEANKSSYFIEGTKVSFKDGWLGGYEFELTKVTPIISVENANYKLTLRRTQNTDAGENNIAYLPDNFINAKAGDHFVLVDCFLPERLTGIAQERLKEAATEMLAGLGPKPQYSLTFDNIYLKRNENIARNFKCGHTIVFDYPASNKPNVVCTIQQIDIREIEGCLREYKIRLSEKIIQNKIKKQLQESETRSKIKLDEVQRVQDRTLKQIQSISNASVFSRLAAWDDYNPTDNSSVLGSQLGYGLKTRLDALPSANVALFDFYIKANEGELINDLELPKDSTIHAKIFEAIALIDAGASPFARLINPTREVIGGPNDFEDTAGFLVPMQIVSWDNNGDNKIVSLQFRYNGYDYTLNATAGSDDAFELTRRVISEEVINLRSEDVFYAKPQVLRLEGQSFNGLYISHPYLDFKDDADIVLMRHRRNRRYNTYYNGSDPEGEAIMAVRNGWGVFGGNTFAEYNTEYHFHKGGNNSIDELVAHLVRHAVRTGPENTDFYTQGGYFRGNNGKKKNLLLGVALRKLNPAFVRAMESSGYDPNEGTSAYQCWKDGIPRYLFSNVTPITIRIGSKDNNSKWYLGIRIDK